MSSRSPFLFGLPFAYLLALPAQAGELPVIGQSAVTTPSRSEEERDLGVEMLWLPVESRDSLTDYVGRNLPGATPTADGLRLRGGRAQDTAFELDGMRVRRLSLPLAMVDRFDLATSGYGAEWGDVMGGVLGVATKSGDNRLRVDVDSFAQSHKTVSTQAGSTTVSLPILKDRLFVLMSVRAETWKDEASPDPEGLLNDPPDLTGLILDGGLKVTWIPAPGHRVESLTLLDTSRQDHTPGLGIEEEAQPTFDETQWTSSLRWMGRLSERIGAHAQVGFQRLRAEEEPLRCRDDPGTCDSIPAHVQKFPRRVHTGNWLNHQIERDTGWQVRAGVDALVKDGPRARERVRLTSRLRTDRVEWDFHRPGDRLIEFNQGPEAETLTFANDARYAPGQFGWFSSHGSWWSTTHALESETRLFDRLWIIPGLDLATSGAGGDNFTLRTSALTPHLGLAWNAFGDGRTWLHASFHERVDADLEDLARFGRTTVIQRKCNWNPDTMAFDRSCVFSGGSHDTVGQPCGVNDVAPDGAPCGAGLELARSREYAVGGSYELGLGVRAGLDLVYRRVTGLPRVVETNQIWSPSGESVVGYRNGRAEKVNDYSTAPDEPDRYLGATASLTRRAGRFKFMLAYTWSHHEVTGTSSDTAVFSGPTSYTGDAQDDRPHGVRALASYDAGGFASVGAVYSYDSGFPFNQLYRPGGSNENYRAAASNPGATLNDPADDGPYRFPSQQRLNLQVRVRAQRLLHVDLDFYVDLLDILSSRKTVEVDSSFTSYTWGGRWGRVGLQYRY